jgi:hypothetical protein
MAKVGVCSIVVGILALLSLSACTDTAGVDDSDPIHVVSKPKFAAATIQASLPGPTSYTINTSVSLPYVANPTIAYLAVSGDITVLDNYVHPGTVVGVIPPGGGHQGLQTMNCYGQVQIWYQYGGSFNVGTDCEGGVRTTPIKMQGNGQASRGPGYPGASPPSCGYYPYTPCYSYTGGSQSITITPIDMQLKLKPSRYVVTSGMSVTFNAFGTPDSVYPYKLPFTVQSWQWTPDSGASSTPCSAGVTACTVTPPKSGTMRVTALVNGEVKSASVHIRVLCQFTSDSLLNNLPLLDAMKTAWDSAYKPNVNDRVEWWWTVDCDVNGVCVASPPILMPGAFGCGSPWPPGPASGWTRRAQGHIHPGIPFKDKTHHGDESPASCPAHANDTLYVTPPKHYISGAVSDSDYVGSSIQPAGIKHCVIDGTNIQCFPMGRPPSVERDSTVKYPRQQPNGCKLARAEIFPGLFDTIIGKSNEESV